MSILASLGSAGSWLLNSAQTVGGWAKGAFDGLNSATTSVLNSVGSFGGENFMPMASGVSGLINGIKQNRINEKVYRLNKYMALHGVEVRQRDLKRAGINPILAGYSPAQGGIASPQYSDAVGSGLNNAMALKEAKLKIKGAKKELQQMELQNKAQELANESQEIINNYQNGKYDEIFCDPLRLAMSDLASSYRDYEQILADFDRDADYGLLSRSQANTYKEVFKHMYNTEYNIGKPRSGVIRKWRAMPLTIRRQYDIDKMQLLSQFQYNQTQQLENFLRSYNNAVLPPAAAAKAANTAAPFVSIGRDVINSASQLFPTGAAANRFYKGLPGNNQTKRR